jgi:hypothetical protein
MVASKGYATEKDILKLVAEKNGVTIEQAQYVYKFMCATVQELARREDVMAIHLPKIGTLYKNSYLIKKYLSLYKDYPSKIVLNAKKSLERIASYRERDPITGMVTKKGIAHRRKPYILSTLFNKFNGCVEKFEEFHNNNNNL